ncbi:MAG: hypothetical protein ACRDU7_07845 [Acidimicrobiia bacterium]
MNRKGFWSWGQIGMKLSRALGESATETGIGSGLTPSAFGLQAKVPGIGL